jgi:hypothetical protein
VGVIGVIEQAEPWGGVAAERREHEAADQPDEQFSHHEGIIASFCAGAKICRRPLQGEEGSQRRDPYSIFVSPS